jgi:hypothetical protein
MTVPPDAIEREVWATEAEFRHGLGLAFPGCVVERHGRLCIDDGRARMEIELAVLAPQSIALLELPRLKVSLRNTAGTPDQFKAMVARMDLAMHRGGG